MKKTIITTLIIAATVLSVNAQKKNKEQLKNWSSYDFVGDHKMGFAPASGAKSLKKTKSFVSSYMLNQASLMTGSERSIQGGASLSSKVRLGGVSQEALNKLVSELHGDLITQLKSVGLEISEGADVIGLDFVKEKAIKDKKVFAGNVNITPYVRKYNATKANPPFSMVHVKESMRFFPQDVNYLINDKTITGTFFQKVAKKTNTNIILVKYNVTFASFKGGKGFKSINLSTNAYMTILPQITIYTPKGIISGIKFSKIWVANNRWLSEKGISEIDSKSNIIGNGSKSEYVAYAEDQLYTAELKATISKFQKDLASLLSK